MLVSGVLRSWLTFVMSSVLNRSELHALIHSAAHADAHGVEIVAVLLEHRVHFLRVHRVGEIARGKLLRRRLQRFELTHGVDDKV